MAKWVLSENDGDWTIYCGGRYRTKKSNERARDKWLKSHMSPGDKLYVREDDGYLTERPKPM